MGACGVTTDDVELDGESSWEQIPSSNIEQFGLSLKQKPTAPQHVNFPRGQAAQLARLDKFAGIEYGEQPSQSRKENPSESA